MSVVSDYVSVISEQVIDHVSVVSDHVSVVSEQVIDYVYFVSEHKLLVKCMPLLVASTFGTDARANGPGQELRQEEGGRGTSHHPRRRSQCLILISLYFKTPV